MGVMGEELTVTGTVRSLEDGVAIVDSEAHQADRRLIRKGEAELRVQRPEGG
jgi:hypothetical protein